MLFFYILVDCPLSGILTVSYGSGLLVVTSVHVSYVSLTEGHERPV